METEQRLRFENARFLTQDPELPEASVMYVEGEKIVWVGEKGREPEVLLAAGYESVDLGGACVIPGFVDAHMHAVMLANFAPQISVLPPAINSVEELVEAVRARREAQGPEAWVEGWGYDEALLAERRSPTRWDLDRGCADAPVCIMRTCGHIRCVNSRALELAGITRDTPDPAGGEIERDASGEPTGVLKETARDLVTPFIPKPAAGDAVRNLVDLGALLASQGIVAVTDMCSVDGTDTYPVLTAAAEAGFAQDVAAYVLWDYIRDGRCAEPAPEQMDHGRQVFTAGIKVLTDGSVSGRTAWFDQPFTPAASDGGEPCLGMPTCADEDITGAIELSRRLGCQISLHAMGTRAIARAVDLLSAEEPWTEGDAPYARVEHVTAPSVESVEAMVRAGIGVVTQPIFPYAEIGTYLTNLGLERTRRCYPLRTMLDAGVRLCISTDAPATSWAVPSDPFPNMLSAVTRRAHDGTDFGVDETLSVEEALALYTREAARMVGFEGLGMLRAGYKASFAVLDRDILAVPTDQLDQVRVAETYVRGRKVY